MITDDRLDAMARHVTRHGCLYKDDALELIRAVRELRPLAEVALLPTPDRVTLIEAEEQMRWVR